MHMRYSHMLVVGVIALWVALVAFGNITDYGSNLVFVQHVLAMDSIFPDATIHYRAIHTPWLQHAAYVLIIATEALTALLCAAGAWAMWDARRAPAARYRHAKRLAVWGLTLGVLLWLGGFVAIGGEWFGMWMSSQWNGIATAFRFAMVLMAALVYLGQPDTELHDR